MVGGVKFRAVVTNISLVDNPWGEKIVKIDVTEEREVPGPVIVQHGSANELSREIAPIISQVLKSMPIPGMSGRIRIPRATLYLTEDEWDRLVRKPSIGDLIEITITNEGDVKVELKG